MQKNYLKFINEEYEESYYELYYDDFVKYVKDGINGYEVEVEEYEEQINLGEHTLTFDQLPGLQFKIQLYAFIYEDVEYDMPESYPGDDEEEVKNYTVDVENKIKIEYLIYITHGHSIGVMLDDNGFYSKITSYFETHRNIYKEHIKLDQLNEGGLDVTYEALVKMKGEWMDTGAIGTDEINEDYNEIQIDYNKFVTEVIKADSLKPGKYLSQVITHILNNTLTLEQFFYLFLMSIVIDSYNNNRLQTQSSGKSVQDIASGLNGISLDDFKKTLKSLPVFKQNGLVNNNYLPPPHHMHKWGEQLLNDETLQQEMMWCPIIRNLISEDFDSALQDLAEF